VIDRHSWAVLPPAEATTALLILLCYFCVTAEALVPTNPAAYAYVKEDVRLLLIADIHQYQNCAATC
jgi:hypothetical protein